MKKQLLLVFFLVVQFAVFGQNKIKTLIVDGQNNHEQWPKITYMMKQYLEQSGLFTVSVARSAYTWRGKDFLEEYKVPGLKPTEALDKSKIDPDFKPNFKAYDLVICNFGWDAAPWPAETQKQLEEFIQKGGGLVVIHAADNSFPEWPAYNDMIGLGGWGDRTEKDGPYVYYNNDGELKHDMSAGKGGSHGPQHEFKITIREPNHPITKGMPKVWLHTIDELYDRLRGPAKNMQVLATAYSSPDKRGTDRHEPMLLTIDYGKGRIFHTPMGHIDQSWECVGLMTSFLRGAEWAATGKVTQPIPKDFPTESTFGKRSFQK